MDSEHFWYNTAPVQKLAVYTHLFQHESLKSSTN